MKIDTPELHRLRLDRHELLGRLPELRVDEIGGDPAHPRQGFRLPRPDFEGARLQRRKGLFYQLITAGGMSSMTSTPVSSNWNRSDWVEE